MNHRQYRIIFFLVILGCATWTPSHNQSSARTDETVTTITAGPEWTPLKLDLDIEPGSALDFSSMGFQDAPAGKHGRVIATPDGQFAFANDPRTPRRFYGVNLCFGAHYLSHAEADRLADRLRRLGYNAVRVHHYERDLVQGQPNSLTFNADKLDQLDYLLAALARRGLYVTTDLFVSRPVYAADLGMEGSSRIEMNTFKILVPVHAGAWKNWQAFARALLDHVNPYTKLRYADDPALAWLSMINEGNFGNYFADLRKMPGWQSAWNAWLAEQYPTREALAAAWGGEWRDREDPQKGDVAFPENIHGPTLRVRDAVAFLAFMERDTIERMARFLRQDLRCRALITNANAWTNHVPLQSARRRYDYVDDHFYIDHPQFLQKSWQLPSRSPNTSPIAGGAAGGRGTTFTRLYDKPFTITEYNYSGPGRFRGVGGILTGALGALQGWGGIWRFAYSHSREAMLQPARLTYFDMASDPLGQAAERASLCLFLRGDMKTAPHSLAIVMTPEDLRHPPKSIPRLAPFWHWAAWVTRVGTQVVDDPAAALPHTAVFPLRWSSPASAYTHSRVAADFLPYGSDHTALVALLRDRGILKSGNPTDPAKSVFQSETGEITIDAPRDTLILDTPRTAGGYAPAGQTIRTADGAVTIDILAADATVWVSALDANPIRRSRRLLVTHLTDLQNSEIQYAEPARQTLLDWGKLPHLVRRGRATVRIKIRDADRMKVWALATGGRRIAAVPASAKGEALEFTADVSDGADSNGARILYEIVRP